MNLLISTGAIVLYGVVLSFGLLPRVVRFLPSNNRLPRSRRNELIGGAVGIGITITFGVGSIWIWVALIIEVIKGHI